MRHERRTERGYDRLVNFSDAVVAIAITLLVLPLTDLVREAQTVPASQLVAENSARFMAFLLTFFVTAIFWLVHHRIFEMIADYDGGLLWLNLLWLLFVVLLPFASGVVSGDGFANGAGLIYAGTMAGISVAQGLIVLYVKFHPGLLTHGTEVADLHPERSWIYAGFFAAVGVVSLWFPFAASLLMILLIPLDRLVSNRT